MTDTKDDPRDRIERLIDLTERLTHLLAEQAQAFEAHRPQTVAPTIEEASRLANLYRKEAAQVRADPEPIKLAPSALRLRLIRATEAFDAVMARQGRALSAAMTVTEGLVHAIVEEVAAQRAKGSPYGPAGGKPKPAPATAVTLNRRA